MVTSFKETFGPFEITDGGPFKGFAYQRESAPGTGTLHWQAYFEFTSTIRMGRVKELIGDPAAHLERRKGTRDEAIKYCSKTESRASEPIIMGSCLPRAGGQGERTDIKKMATIVRDDPGRGGMEKLIAENPELYIKYNRGFEKLQAKCFKPRPWRTLQVIVLTGAAGCGKTRWAHENFPDLYRVMKPNRGGTLWFDGYDHHKAILIDDFRGWLPFSTMLHICDGYPYQVQIKGGTTWGDWDTVIITSNEIVEKWWSMEPTKLAPMLRRITLMFENNVQTYPSVTP